MKSILVRMGLFALLLGIVLPLSAITAYALSIRNAPCTVTLNGVQQTGTCSGSFSPKPTPVPIPPPPVSSPNGYPDATTTGVPPGTVLTDRTSSLDVTTDGTVIDAMYFHSGAGLSVHANNVTVKRTRILCDLPCWQGSNLIYLDPSKSGFTIQDSELDGGSLPRSSTPNGFGSCDADAMSGMGYTALRVNVHGTGAGLKPGGFDSSLYPQRPYLMQDSYVHDLAVCDEGLPGGSHNDAFISNGYFGGISLRHNSLERNGQTCALCLFSDFDRIANVTADNNLLNGGSYTTYAGPIGKPHDADPGAWTNIQFTGNHFGRKFFSNGGAYGPIANCSPTDASKGNLWSGNAWDGTGLPVACG